MSVADATVASAPDRSHPYSVIFVTDKAFKATRISVGKHGGLISIEFSAGETDGRLITVWNNQAAYESDGVALISEHSLKTPPLFQGKHEGPLFPSFWRRPWRRPTLWELFTGAVAGLSLFVGALPIAENVRSVKGWLVGPAEVQVVKAENYDVLEGDKVTLRTTLKNSRTLGDCRVLFADVTADDPVAITGLEVLGADTAIAAAGDSPITITGRAGYKDGLVKITLKGKASAGLINSESEFTGPVATVRVWRELKFERSPLVTLLELGKACQVAFEAQPGASFPFGARVVAGFHTNNPSEIELLRDIQFYTTDFPAPRDEMRTYSLKGEWLGASLIWSTPALEAMRPVRFNVYLQWKGAGFKTGDEWVAISKLIKIDKYERLTQPH